MAQTTFNSENMNRPAPKWWRKLEDGLLMIIIPAAVAIVSSWGELDDLKTTRALLLINVGLVALIKFIGKMLANGEEYAPKSTKMLMWIFIFISASLFFSCSTSKNIQTETAVADSESYKRLRSLYETSLLENSVLKQQVKELESVGVVFQECPPELNTDSLISVIKNSGCDDTVKVQLINRVADLQKQNRQSQAEIKRLADGTLEIKGNLASYKQSKERLEETLSETVRKLNEGKSVIADLSQKLKIEQARSSKIVERVYFPPLFWLITCLFAFLWFRKQFFTKTK